MKNSWIDFWKSRALTPERDQVWRMNMDFFLKATESILEFNQNDIVLDIGCGPGYLSEALVNTVKEIHSVDISKSFIDLCKQKFKNNDNLFFHALDENEYTNFYFLPQRYFTKIICLSVIQYYTDHIEVEKLIKGAKKVASYDACFLIADIPKGQARLLDIWSVLKLGLKTNNFLTTIKYLFQMNTKDYNEVHAKNNILHFSEDSIADTVRRLGLDFEILHTQLTINKSRFHLLIRF